MAALSPDWAQQRREVLAANVSLVVSHYARSMATALHHAEVEAAISVNAANPLFGRVVVFFEVTADDGCSNLSQRLLAAVPHPERKRAMRRLECLARRTQPTYFELFAFVSTTPLLPLVVLANADVIFDATLAQLPPLAHGELHVLTVNAVAGRSRARTWAETWAALKADAAERRCPIANMPSWGPRWNASVFSWDAYVLRPPLPHFSRWQASATAANTTAANANASRLGLAASLGFFMNEMNAENEAVCALELLTGVRVHAPCLLVRVRHLHRAPKTHRNSTALRKQLGIHAPCHRLAVRRTGHGPRPDDWRAVYAHDPCEYHFEAAPNGHLPPGLSYVVPPQFCSNSPSRISSQLRRVATIAAPRTRW